MARAGFKGSGRSLVTALGSIAGQVVKPEAVAAPLDYGNLALSRTLFKRHAACYRTHGALDALAAMDLPEPECVRRIVVEVPQHHAELAQLPLAANTLAGQFSLPYSVATAAMLRATDFDAFGWRPAVARFARLVQVVPAKDLEPWGARVAIECSDGTRLEGESRGRPRALAQERVRERFLVQVGEPAERWWPRLTDLGAVTDCARLFDTDE